MSVQEYLICVALFGVMAGIGVFITYLILSFLAMVEDIHAIREKLEEKDEE